MTNNQSFSKRHQIKAKEKDITIREDSPQEFREALLQVSRQVELLPSEIREIVCRVLKKLPDYSNNWSQYPNIWLEVQGYILNCEWFQVYDIAEAIFEYLANKDNARAEKFEILINETFREVGIGWQLIQGLIQTRGSEAFETSVSKAKAILEMKGRKTASKEIHEALNDLSRKPDADLTGAIQHAMAALECVARDVCGDSKATLGEIMKKYPIIPRPLDDVISKAWGYASEMGRHLQEGRVPSREEAELIVGLAATCATYLVNKSKKL